MTNNSGRQVLGDLHGKLFNMVNMFTVIGMIKHENCICSHINAKSVGAADAVIVLNDMLHFFLAKTSSLQVTIFSFLLHMPVISLQQRLLWRRNYGSFELRTDSYS